MMEFDFKEVFYKWYRPLCFFAEQIIKDRSVAEDLVQEVFLDLWENEARFLDEKNLRNYLYKCVRNACLNYVKRLGIMERNIRMATLDAEEDEQNFLFSRIESETIQEIFQAIDELPKRSREIFCLAYLEEKGEKEISQQLKISVNTVKTHKLRAKTFLKGRLKELFIYIFFFIPGF